MKYGLSGVEHIGIKKEEVFDFEINSNNPGCSENPGFERSGFYCSLFLNKLRSLPLKYLDTTNQCANRQMRLSDIDY